MMIMIGITRTASVSPPEMKLRPDAGARDAPHRLHEDHEPEDPVDDRRHAGQVADVRVDQPVDASVPRVLLAGRPPRRSRAGTAITTTKRSDQRTDRSLPHAGPAREARTGTVFRNPRPRSEKTGQASLITCRAAIEHDAETRSRVSEQRPLEDGPAHRALAHGGRAPPVERRWPRATMAPSVRSSARAGRNARSRR